MLSPEVTSAVFGLLSAALWGAGDFSGGLATRRGGERGSAFGVVLASQTVGVVLLAGLALAFGEALPSPASWLWGALAGLGGGLGLLALYAALARGQMGVVAPASAMAAALLPVVAGAALDGLPGALQLAGFALALGGVWLLSRPETGAGAPSVGLRSLALPVAAGAAFGLFFVALDRVADGAVFWPLVAARLASMGLVLGGALAARQPLGSAAREWPLVALSGVLDAGGNACFVLAARAGRLDVAAVLSSLYPASTVVLAGIILKERLTRRQTVGVAAALAAILLIVL